MNVYVGGTCATVLVSIIIIGHAFGFSCANMRPRKCVVDTSVVAVIQVRYILLMYHTTRILSPGQLTSGHFINMAHKNKSSWQPCQARLFQF